MAAAAILNFQKFKLLTVDPLLGPMCVILPNFIKIGQTVAEIWRFNGFQNGGRLPSSICWVPTWTTHDDFLMVSIVVQNLVQNLVEIDAVVSIT